MSSKKINTLFRANMMASRDYPSVFEPGKLWRPNKRCKTCIYRGGDNQKINGCDYLLITGKCRTAEINNPELLHPSKCPLYVNGGRQTAVDHFPLTDKYKGKIKHEEFKRLWEQGATDKELASAFGVTPNTIAIYRRKRGFPCNVEKRTTFEVRTDYENMQRLYAGGCWDREISETLGCAVSTVIHWRKVNGLPSQSEKIEVLRNRKYKELYDRGLRDNEIAQSMGVTASAVRQWRMKQKLQPNV